jgi:hypothetical protein
MLFSSKATISAKIISQNELIVYLEEKCGKLMIGTFSLFQNKGAINHG